MRKLIDITNDDLAILKQRAERSNMKVKPYIEWLIKKDCSSVMGKD